MAQRSQKHRVLPLALGTLAAVGTLASSPALAATSSKSVTYKGSVVDFRWGTMQVAIVTKNKKITNVKPSVYVHTDRSVFINDQALPMLKDEVLQAQNAKIDTISGATDSSVAYIESLHSAVKKAEKARAIK